MSGGYFSCCGGGCGNCIGCRARKFDNIIEDEQKTMVESLRKSEDAVVTLTRENVVLREEVDLLKKETSVFKEEVVAQNASVKRANISMCELRIAMDKFKMNDTPYIPLVNHQELEILTNANHELKTQLDSETMKHMEAHACVLSLQKDLHDLTVSHKNELDSHKTELDSHKNELDLYKKELALKDEQIAKLQEDLSKICKIVAFHSHSHEEYDKRKSFNELSNGKKERGSFKEQGLDCRQFEVSDLEKHSLQYYKKEKWYTCRKLDWLNSDKTMINICFTDDKGTVRYVFHAYVENMRFEDPNIEQKYK